MLDGFSHQCESVVSLHSPTTWVLRLGMIAISSAAIQAASYLADGSSVDQGSTHEPNSIVSAIGTADAEKLALHKRLHPTWYHALPPNPDILDVVCCPFKQACAIKRRLVDNFGLHFIIILTSIYCVIKGTQAIF